MAALLRAIFFAVLLAAESTAVSAVEVSPVGRRRTIDAETGADNGLIEITSTGDTLEGRIVRMVMKPGEAPDPICEKCEGAQKGQRVLGLTILRGFRRDGDVWDGGTILDPWTGSLYSAQLRLDETGNKLFVRGYLGIPLLGRTQTWLRGN